MRLSFKICFDKFRKRKMTANELEKLRLSILDEAEQRKGTAFSIIVLAVLASALWLFSILEIKMQQWASAGS